jgi:hypothetical protein
VYAAVTRSTGADTSEMAELAVMVGETMVSWLTDIEGFKGLLMLTDKSTGTVDTIALWENERIAERHQLARANLRARVTATVNVQIEETVGWDVPFVYLPAGG